MDAGAPTIMQNQVGEGPVAMLLDQQSQYRKHTSQPLRSVNVDIRKSQGTNYDAIL